MNKLIKKRGYTILILILVLMAISLSIIISTTFLGVDESKLSRDRFNSDLGLYLSTSCVEEALRQIKAKPNYAPVTSGKKPQPKWTTVNVYTTTNRCSYQVINKNPPKYIKARSGVGSALSPHNLEIEITGVNPITFGYWREQ